MNQPPFKLPELFRIGILAIGLVILNVHPGLATAPDLPVIEKRKIETMITEVERMTDATFIRNGKKYNATVAAEFLRRKWKSRRSEIHSAAEFIDKVASISSRSGKPYRIRWTDGKERTSAEYFRAQLSLLEGRSGQPPG